MNIEDRLSSLGKRGESARPHTAEQQWESFRSSAHRSLARRRIASAVAAAAIIVVGAIAANAVVEGTLFSSDTEIGSPGDRRSLPPPRGVEVVKVWFVQNGKLAPVYQLTGAGTECSDETGCGVDGVALTRDALERLVKGVPGPVSETTDPPVTTHISPFETEIISAQLEPRSVVNLSTFSEGLTEREKELAAAQVAATVLGLDSLGSVEVLEDGEPLTAEPLTRDMLEPLLPPIVLDYPAYAEQPQSYVEYVPLYGTANVYEGTVAYELTMQNGIVLEEGFTTAECGSGCRGSFSDKVRFDVSRPMMAFLSVYSESAEDGSRMFEVRHPVYLCPSGEPESFAVRLEENQKVMCGGME